MSSIGTSAPVTFTGIATGINAGQIIQAEQAPETAVVNEYTAEVGTLTDANTAWQTILNDLQAIGSQATTLDDPMTFQAMSAESSNTAALTASATTGAPAGSYALNVTALAQGQESVSTGTDNSATALDFGTGTLTFQIGTATPVSVSIGSGQNSLTGIAAAINAAGIGITAQVAQTGVSTYQLLLTGSGTGTTNAFTVTDGLSGGATTLGPFGTVQAAQNASLTLGSGAGAITATSASNTVSNLLSGVTLSLVGQGQTTVTVSPDTSGETTSVENFITAYNQLVTDTNTQNTFNTSTDTPGGPLFGNSLLDLISGSVADAVMNPVAAAPTAVNSLAMVGVSMNSDGTLSVNNSTLQAALAANPQGVQTLLQGVAQATNAALTTLDTASSGAVPEAMTSNTDQITQLNTTITNLQTQMAQEALIMQQEFTAMEQAVSQDQGLLTYLQGESAELAGLSSSSSSGSTGLGTSSTTGTATTSSSNNSTGTSSTSGG